MFSLERAGSQGECAGQDRIEGEIYVGNEETDSKAAEESLQEHGGVVVRMIAERS